ncbi:MAG: hypothetical protein QM786_10480 [Breznakibacter sp.]
MGRNLVAIKAMPETENKYQVLNDMNCEKLKSKIKEHCHGQEHGKIPVAGSTSTLPDRTHFLAFSPHPAVYLD